MEYLFVLKDIGTSNQGWWLKISSIKELLNYHKLTESIWGDVLDNYLSSKSYGGSGSHCDNVKCDSLTNAVVMNAANKGLTIFEGIRSYKMELVLNQAKEIKESGAIYINRLGGYHGAYEGDNDKVFVRRKEMVFPEFKRGEIRIKKFSGGAHYYAYIDDMQVRNGDKLKWDSYAEAYEYAASIVNKA